jgi:hypothetical protein
VDEDGSTDTRLGYPEETGGRRVSSKKLEPGACGCSEEFRYQERILMKASVRFFRLLPTNSSCNLY